MNPPDQPTPRTDAAIVLLCDLHGVEIDFARTLERELAETERLRFSADADRRRLRCELAAAQAEALHYMAVAQKATDELIFFRADNLKAHQMTCAAALERDRLRAEVERLKVEDTDWELAFQAATQLIADSEAELAAANKRIADCEFLLEHRYKIIQQQEPRCNEAIARAEKAEAERDRADAEVAALKKVLLEFGQLPSTQP
jgi:hypothetical protein